MIIYIEGFGNVTSSQDFEYLLNKKRLTEIFQRMKENSFEPSIRWREQLI